MVRHISELHALIMYHQEQKWWYTKTARTAAARTAAPAARTAALAAAAALPGLDCTNHIASSTAPNHITGLNTQHRVCCSHKWTACMASKLARLCTVLLVKQAPVGVLADQLSPGAPTRRHLPSHSRPARLGWLRSWEMGSRETHSNPGRGEVGGKGPGC